MPLATTKRHRLRDTLVNLAAVLLTRLLAKQLASTALPASLEQTLHLIVAFAFELM